MHPACNIDKSYLNRLKIGRRNDSSRLWLCQFSWEGALGNGFIILTGGAFLTSLALNFGAGDFEIGLLCAIPFLAQVAQLFSSWAINLAGSRKAVTLLGFMAGRLIWLMMIPLLFVPTDWKLELFLAVVVISNFSVMLATPGWLAWISDLVPIKIRGRYFGRRASALAASTVVVTIIGGILLDLFQKINLKQLGFALIITLACLLALISIVVLRKLPDPQRTHRIRHYSMKAMIEPFKDQRYRNLLAVFFAWNVAIGFSAVFFAAHMLTNLKMSFTLIAVYTSTVALVAVFLNRPWGCLIDRFGSKPVLTICAFGVAIVPLIWLLPRADWLWILAFESIYTGALWAGFNLAAFNMPIANSPRENRPSYLAVFSVVTGFGFFIASLVGGVLAEMWYLFHFQVGPQIIVNYHLLFVISSLLRIISAVLILKFHEPHEKSIPVMVQFMGYATLKHLSLGRQVLPFSIKRNNEIHEGCNHTVNYDYLKQDGTEDGL